jgi:NADH-quinone oxidoreductase subunit K
VSGLHLAVPLAIACALFGIGVYIVLARRNAILMLMGVELMLNAATLMLVSFDVYYEDPLLSGQSAALFFITMAAAEIGLALAIVLRVFRAGGSIALDTLTTLADRDEPADPAAPVGSTEAPATGRAP